MVQDIIEKLTVTHIFKKTACFLYGNLRFIIVFTKVRHWTLTWASQI